MSQGSEYRSRSLTAHLVGFALALVAPLLLFAALGAMAYTRAEMSANEERLKRLSADVTNDVDREIKGFLTLLSALALSDSLREDDYAAFHAQTKAALRHARTYVLLLDPSLTPIMDTRAPYGAQSPRSFDRDVARYVLDNPGVHVSGLVDPSSPGDHGAIVIGLPVMRDGSVHCILLMTITTARVHDAIATTALPTGWSIVIYDRNGKVISRSPDNDGGLEVALGRRDANGRMVTRQDARGVTRLEIQDTSGVTGWRTIVSAPQKLLEASLWQSLGWLAAAAVLAGLLTTLLAILVGRRMARSMSRVTLATRKLASGGVVEAEGLPLSEADQVMKTLSLASMLIHERTEALKISEERSREQVEHIKMLMRELAHRNKNQLAVIQSMARQVGKGSEGVDDFLESFTARLHSMIQSQELVFGRDRGDAPLSRLVRDQLTSFADVDGGRVVIEGPDIALTADAAQTIGLALHELATNAIKYGALHGPEGTVYITWSIREGADGGLRLSWRESGGPQVVQPEQWGFGRVVIERLVAQTLDGNVVYQFPTGGVLWILEAPHTVIAEPRRTRRRLS